MDDYQQTMCIREQRAVAEPVEELEEVVLDDTQDQTGNLEWAYWQVGQYAKR